MQKTLETCIDRGNLLLLGYTITSGIHVFHIIYGYYVSPNYMKGMLLKVSPRGDGETPTPRLSIFAFLTYFASQFLAHGIIGSEGLEVVSADTSQTRIRPFIRPFVPA